MTQQPVKLIAGIGQCDPQVQRLAHAQIHWRYNLTDDTAPLVVMPAGSRDVPIYKTTADNNQKQMVFSHNNFIKRSASSGHQSPVA